MEQVWQRDCANHSEAMTDVVDYLVGFYNSTRLHSKLSYLPPPTHLSVNRQLNPPINMSKIT